MIATKSEVWYTRSPAEMAWESGEVIVYQFMADHPLLGRLLIRSDNLPIWSDLGMRVIAKLAMRYTPQEDGDE